MMVAQYDTQFTRLSHYAKYLILNKKMRVEGFMNQLRDYFDRVIIIETITYQQALNQAIIAKICSKE